MKVGPIALLRERFLILGDEALELEDDLDEDDEVWARVEERACQ